MNAVIFDMDGVIIDSESLHLQADQAMLQKLGIELPESALEKYIGSTDSAMWKDIIKTHTIETDLQEILNAQLSIKLKLLKKSDLQAIDGIVELLKELRRHDIPAVIASSSAGILIKETVKKLGLERFIADWVSGESLPKSKPEPDIFLRAAELLGEDPSGCVVIEDSRNGVLAAKRALMKCVGFQNPTSGNQDLSSADLVVQSIRELTVSTLMKL